jgi:hypothetical protein
VSLLPDGQTVVYSAIAELKKYGYCTVVTNRVNGKITGNEYLFYPSPTK